jgi:hypothetical protein
MSSYMIRVGRPAVSFFRQRVVTGSQDKRAYKIKTPYGTLGVRGNHRRIFTYAVHAAQSERVWA